MVSEEDRIGNAKMQAKIPMPRHAKDDKYQFRAENCTFDENDLVIKPDIRVLIEAMCVIGGAVDGAATGCEKEFL